MTTTASDQVFVPDAPLTQGSIALGSGLRNLAGTGDIQAEGNTAVGMGAGESLRSGYANTLIGFNAGYSMTYREIPNTFTGGTGNSGNVFIGYYCGTGAVGAFDNTMVGVYAGYELTGGMDNAGFGINALRKIKGGSENAAFGHGALQHIEGSGDFATGDGHRLTATGDMAGRYLNNDAEKTGGRTSVYLGARTRSASNTAENETVIGYDVDGRGSNTVAIGNDDVTEVTLAGVTFTKAQLQALLAMVP